MSVAPRVALGLLLSLAAVPGTAGAEPRIVGGIATQREWPAFAQLRIDTAGGPFLCGGSLIAASWVLTAAHCVEDVTAAGQVTLVLGRRASSGPGGESRTARSVPVVHEAYSPNLSGVPGQFSPYNDVALVELDVPATGVPQPLVGAGDDGLSAPAVPATVLGFGTTAEDGTPSGVLKEAQVPIVTDASCAGVYGSAVDASAEICAGAVAGTDTCQGDSGGPLLVPLGTRALRLSGVTSFGNGCARAGVPGVYARMGALQAWVRARVALDGLSFAPVVPRADQDVTLTATSTSPAAPTALGGEPQAAPTFRWDLDGDDVFDDGVGQQVTGRVGQEGERSVAVEAVRGGLVQVVRSGVEVAPSPSVPASAPPAPAPVVTPAPTPVPAPSGATPVRRASLSVVAQVPGRRARRATLRCSPTGGTLSSRRTACVRLLRARGADPLLRRLPSRRGRVRVAGAALTVTGTVAGRRVDLRLPTRGSPSARERYVQVRRLLGPSAVDALARR